MGISNAANWPKWNLRVTVELTNGHFDIGTWQRVPAASIKSATKEAVEYMAWRLKANQVKGRSSIQSMRVEVVLCQN